MKRGALARTLPAMTAVQAMVAMSAFALSVLAPQLGIGIQRLGLLGSTLFAIGALASLASGWLIRRFGDLQVAGLCMLAVALAMLCLLGAVFGLASAWAPWVAMALIGLAFGPETPASASVLSRVTPAARRPLVFSVRQTGNQLGAIAGSLALPWLVSTHLASPFAALGLLAAGVAAWCFALERGEGQPAASRGTARAGGLGTVLRSPALRWLAAATLAYSATQVCLNLFVMSHAVNHWRLGVGAAAGWVAWMQAGGLLGRLLWGWLAQGAGVDSARLLGALGVTMCACGFALFVGPAVPSTLSMALLLVLIGVTASGWNGVMVAEVSRVAGTDRAGAVTGAVLMVGYSGLALAPVVYAAAADAAGTGIAFCVFFGAAGVVGAGGLLRARRTADGGAT